MTRNVWSVAELRAILAALSLTSAELPEPQRRGYAQALASVALAVGIRSELSNANANLQLDNALKMTTIDYRGAK